MKETSVGLIKYFVGSKIMFSVLTMLVLLFGIGSSVWRSQAEYMFIGLWMVYSLFTFVLGILSWVRIGDLRK